MPGSTRYVETTLGIVTYAELAPHLAVRVQNVQFAILEGAFHERELDETLLMDLHGQICSTLIPAIAGRWRHVNVQVGLHVAPPFHEVAMLMRDYCLDLQARTAALDGYNDDAIIELLAFAEGRLLSIHPFEDFNGRVTRLFLSELYHRLKLPDVDLTPDPGSATDGYLAALRAADQNNWLPLVAIWHQRFEAGGDS